MAVTREQMLEEAIKRMNILKMLENPIRDLKEDGVVNRSEGGGYLYRLNDDQKKMVEEFEKENETLVYHVIHSFTDIGEMYTLMYVSQYEEEWNDDIEDLKNGSALVYVVNATMPVCSEFGSVGVEPSIGGVKRTW